MTRMIPRAARIAAASPARRAVCASALASLCAAALPARAQDFPARPLRLILSVGPGSGGDVILRFIAERLSIELGQQVVVENKPGAESLLATQSVLGAPADGYSLLLVSPQLISVPLLNPAARYDPLRDLRMLGMIARGPAVFVTGPRSRFSSFARFVDESRGKPAAASLAVYGNSYRVGARLLERQGGPAFTEVLYKGFTQAVTDVGGGTVDLALVDAGAAVPLVKSGQLRALASTGVSPIADLPSVPTVRDSGFPNYDLYIWTGICVRGDTPEPIAQRLEQGLERVLRSPEFRTFIQQRSPTSEVVALVGAGARKELEREADRYSKIIRSSNLDQK